MRLLKYNQFLQLFEGGNAIESRPMTQAETITTYDYVKKKVFPLIGLDGDGVDAAPIGSFGKKMADKESSDIDIAVSVDKIAGVNGIGMEEVLNWLDEKLSKAGFLTAKVGGFNQISIGVPIGGKASNGIGQVDLMLSTSLDWSKFMYYSPDFKVAESKYKGLYRNTLMMSIFSEGTKKVIKSIPTGETEEYEHMVIRLESGLASVRKTLMGKKGALVKTPTILKEFDRDISNVPEEIVTLAFGEGVKPGDVMTFENAWAIFESNRFPYVDKREAILKRFKAYILAAKVPMPEEAVHKYPNIFEQ
jgi:hypothetical protein